MHTSKHQNRGFSFFETTLGDIRQGVRVLSKSPTFTFIAIFSLALGIGANAATFAFADAILLRPLPIAAADEVVTLGSINLASASTSNALRMSYPDFVDLRERTRSFNGLAASLFLPMQFRGEGDETPVVRTASLVSGDFLDVLGVAPALGRGFLASEGAVPSRDAVVMISHQFWQAQYAADTSIIGRTMTLNGVEFSIVGVLPEQFTGLDNFVRPDFYAPLMMWPALIPAGDLSPLEQRDRRSLTLHGRLRSGIDLDTARGEVAGIGQSLAQTHPATNRGYQIQVRTEFEDRVQTASILGTTVAMLLTLGALVLLVACINVAGLLASRIPDRAAEISLRLSLGAGRARIVRQLLTENALLAAVGGLAGIGVGYLGVQLWSQVIVQSDVAVDLAFQMDDRFFLVSIVVSAASVLFFGVVPALQGARTNLTQMLSQSGRGIAGRIGWGRQLLVGGQVSIALVLIAIAVFMYTAFLRQVEAGPGIRIDDIITMSFNPRLSQYNIDESQRFYESLIERARGLPGVDNVSLASFVPMSGFSAGSTNLIPENYAFPDGLESEAIASSHVDVGYFDVLGVPILEGRPFEDRDTTDTVRVAIVNELFAERFWPGSDALGRRFRTADSDTNSWVEIVGVVPNGRYFSISENPTPFIYLPYQQELQSRMTLVVRTLSDPTALAEPLRSIVSELDRNLAITAVRTMPDLYYDTTIRNFLVIMRAIGAMGIIGVTLAFVGLYGLVTSDVNRRRREIGIRMAVGASRLMVLRMILFRGMRPAVIGLLIGIFLMIGVSQAMVAAFPGGGGGDRGLTVWLYVTGAVLAVTAIAAYLPARRAAAAAPTQALRYE